MAKHTPGPWIVEGTLIAQEPGIADSLEVAFLAELGGGMDKHMRKANANLIAAAPELLDALRYAVDNPEFNSGVFDAMARAAIAKAIGDA